MDIFDDYAYYYNLFYKDKNYTAEAERINHFLKLNKRNIKKILDLGCGTGRHDMELTKVGYEVHGIDISAEMIQMAKNNNSVSGGEISFEVADIRAYTNNVKYDAVISLFHVMSYQNTNEDIAKSFNTAYKHLEKGGMFIFDVWYGPGVLRDLPTVRIKNVEDANYDVMRIADPIMHPNENIVDVCYEVLVADKKTSVLRKINEIHKMRYFFYPEIKLLLENTGFELMACYDCNTLSTPDFNSWTVYFIAIRV